MKLISFLAACTVPYFGFATKALLITHPCVTAGDSLHSVKAFSLSHSAPIVSRLGADKRLGGNTARAADLNR